MSSPKVLTCPACGAKLNITGDEAQVQCEYCGNTIVVPEELRSPKAEPVSVNPQVVIVQTNPETIRTVTAATTAVTAGTSIFGCLLTLVILGMVGGILFFVFLSLPQEARDPLQSVFQDAASTGFAKRVASFGDEGTGAGYFQDSRHVAVDGKGNVYVSDYETMRIQRFDKDGKFLNLWTVEEKSATKVRISKLAADRDGNVYTIWDKSILKYDGATGKQVAKITGEITNRTLGWTEEIQDIAVLTNGNILAITNNQNSDDLVRFDPTGKVLGRVKKVVSTPKDDSVFASSLRLAVDGLGNIFIVDGFPSKPYAYKYSPEGKYLNRFGGKGKEPGQFDAFNDLIGVDAKSRVYIKDWNKLLVFDGEGRYINTIAANLYENVLYDFAFNDANELFVVSKNKVFKLALNEPGK